MIINPIWIAVVVLLWGIPVLAFVGPALIRDAHSVFRANDCGTTLFVCLVIIAAVYAFPSAQAKSGPTNPPPAVVAGKRINLYYHAPDGRLVPLNAKIGEVGK
jgi:hypothetical protein